jgi:class 3 adenylate cyclase/ankyrin repeat protein
VVERKLAAILSADIVGFSRLAGADEERTLARLRALRSDLLDPSIAVHGGRVVKRIGDGVLVEFRSVVNAVRCALEMQNGMVERNAGLPPERRIEFRVGIHVGDVIEESDGDLMGDGVNIAARLEGIAKPGTICLSEDAYRQVRTRLDFAVTDLGKQSLKNIAEPVRVYSLQVGPLGKARSAVPKSMTSLIVSGVAAVVLVAMASVVWYFLQINATAPKASQGTALAPLQNSSEFADLGEPLIENKELSGSNGIDTVSGLVWIRPDGPGILDGRTAYWNYLKLTQNQFLGISKVYPDRGKPDLVVLSSSDGGNCCAPRPVFVDLKTDPPYVAGLPIGERQLEVYNPSFEMYAFKGPSIEEKNAYGDPLEVTMFYYRSRGIVIRAPFDGKTDFAKFVHRHPDELLGDPIARKPLVEALGKDFADFRVHVGTADGVEVRDQRYLVASGWVPHGGLNGGLLIFDVATGHSWTFWNDGEVVHTGHNAGELPFPDLRYVVDVWTRERRGETTGAQISKSCAVESLSPRAPSHEPTAELIDAMRTGNVAKAYDALAAGAGVNSQDANGVTPIVAAISAIDKSCLSAAQARDVVQFLFTHGADVNMRNKRGITPLGFARTSYTAGLLLDHGADVNVAGFRSTPLGLAVLRASLGMAEPGNNDLIALLISRGAQDDDLTLDRVQAVAAPKVRRQLVELLKAAAAHRAADPAKSWGGQAQMRSDTPESPALLAQLSANRVVSAFYLALGRGDGATASSLVIPEHQNGGLGAQAITNFYSRLIVPLQLLSVVQLPPNDYQATYTYRASVKSACNGSATVTVTDRNGRYLIEKIDAHGGC